MKTVVIQTTAALACACDAASDHEVIICLDDTALLAPIECETGGDETYPFTTLAGTIKKGWKATNDCGVTVFSYAVEYDEDLLADPDTALLAADVTGIFCKDCKTTYMEELAGNEVTLVSSEDGGYIFTSQHGCETLVNPAGETCVEDSATIDFSLTEDACVTGSVKLSADVGNQITAEDDGLFVPAQEPPCVEDSLTVDLSLTEEGCVTADVLISSDAGNILLSNSDGLFVPPFALCTQETDTINLVINEETGCLIAGGKISADAGNIVEGRVDGFYATGLGLPALRILLGDDTVLVTDTAITLDAQFGNIMLTIPDPDVLYGAFLDKTKFLFIKRIDASGNSVFISGKIDGPLAAVPLSSMDGVILMGRTDVWYTVART